MIVFMLLGIFAMIGIFFALVAYMANNRKRAGMKGVDPAATTHTPTHR